MVIISPNKIFLLTRKSKLEFSSKKKMSLFFALNCKAQYIIDWRAKIQQKEGIADGGVLFSKISKHGMLLKQSMHEYIAGELFEH